MIIQILNNSISGEIINLKLNETFVQIIKSYFKIEIRIPFKEKDFNFTSNRLEVANNQY